MAIAQPIVSFCSTCFQRSDGLRRCPHCASPRLLSHPEIFDLDIAHIDCDAFYASVEKRDRPELKSRPVIVGGGHRGVVSTCCYIARLSGVNSAMPMSRAIALCPDAVVIAPDFRKYSEAAQEIRELMFALTPQIEILSIDEAVLDLTGTEALHNASPAIMLARLSAKIETDIGLTVSIGLSSNRMLARLAASFDKPRGFSVLGSEAPGRLASEKLCILPGVGRVRANSLAARGFITIGQVQALSPQQARQLLGDDGPALVQLANGIDTRTVDPERSRSVTLSAETTLDQDCGDLETLSHHLWRLTEKLTHRLAKAGYCAAGITLKLKTANFTLRTRAARLAGPSILPDILFEAAQNLLKRETTGTKFRLIGIGASPLADLSEADAPDLAAPDLSRRTAREAAITQLREKFGQSAVQRGRALPPKTGA